MGGLHRCFGLIFLLLAGFAAHAAAAKPGPNVLVFSHSTGFRHDSIEPGVAAIKALGEREGFTVVATEDPAVFSDAKLRDFQVILLLSTTSNDKAPESEWFVGDRRTALQAFVRRGGGIVGVHAAADSHYHWPWYGRMIGGRFARHPKGAPTATVSVVDADHPATAGLPKQLSRADEWYYYDDFDPETRLLMTFDPASIGEKDVNPNPIAWAHTFEGGRVFYTGMGHTKESFEDATFLKHLAGGIRWAAGS